MPLVLVEDSDFSDLEADTERGHRDVKVLRDGPLPRTEVAPDRCRLVRLLAQALRRDATMVSVGKKWRC
jgi:hypothetical protein